MLNHTLNIEKLINAYFSFSSAILGHSLNYTDLVIERAGKLIGATTKSLDALFNVQVGNMQMPSWRRNQDYSEKVQRFQEEFEDQKFFLLY